jgi:hypothetical protein
LLSADHQRGDGRLYLPQSIHACPISEVWSNLTVPFLNVSISTGRAIPVAVRGSSGCHEGRKSSSLSLGNILGGFIEVHFSVAPFRAAKLAQSLHRRQNRFEPCCVFPNIAFSLHGRRHAGYTVDLKCGLLGEGWLIPMSPIHPPCLTISR